jgi:hypothetical protein
VKTAAGVAALLGGVLLLVIPRFIFPACEYLGHGWMRCSNAARGEFVVGGLLAATGVLLLALRPGWGAAGAAAFGAALCAAAFLLPAYTRYCMNPDMPCHYGMVPSVRFIGALVGLVELGAFVSLARAGRKP